MHDRLLTHYFASRDALIRAMLVMSDEPGEVDQGVLFRQLASALGDDMARERLGQLYDAIEERMAALIESARTDCSFACTWNRHDLAHHLVAVAEGFHMASIARPDRFPTTRKRALFEAFIDAVADTNIIEWKAG